MATEADSLLAGIHMLVAATLPTVYIGLISFFEAVNEIVTAAEEALGRVPGFEAEAAKYESFMIFDYKQRPWIIPSFRIKLLQIGSIIF